MFLRWGSPILTDTARAQEHIDEYWVPFCEEAIRMFFICGFVPWHIRRLPSTGDLVPEVVPLGTFTWHVELRSERQRRQKRKLEEEAARTSYVPAVVDPKINKRGIGHFGVAWHNPEEGTNASDTGHGLPKKVAGAQRDPPPALRGVSDLINDSNTRSIRTENVEMGHPKGAKRIRADSETKYVQYRVRVNEGGLAEDEIFIYDYVSPK
jgi:hypothetical protein